MSMQFQPGVYQAKITNWGMGKAKTGTPQWVVKFQPVGMLNQSNPDADLIPCANFERTIFRAITENTIDYFVDDLKKLGIEVDSFEALDPGNANAIDLMGVDITVSCDHETYQGQQKERWKFNFGGGDIAPIERNELNKLNAMFGKKLKETKKAKTSSTVPMKKAGPMETQHPIAASVGGLEEEPF